MSRRSRQAEFTTGGGGVGGCFPSLRFTASLVLCWLRILLADVKAGCFLGGLQSARMFVHTFLVQGTGTGMLLVIKVEQILPAALRIVTCPSAYGSKSYMLVLSTDSVRPMLLVALGMHQAQLENLCECVEPIS